MNSIVKWCIMAASLLVLDPLFVQAETMFSGYMSEKESLSKSQIDILRAENAELNEEIKKLNLLLANKKYALAILNKSLESIKDTSAEYTELETKYNEAALMISKQNKKVDDLEDEITKLLRQQNIRWFFSGGAVFLLGFIIGYSARREKRRSLL